MEVIFSHSTVTDELSEISQEEYEKYPAVLPLADGFLEKNIMLTFQEYTACIAAARRYSEEQKNYEFRLTKVKGFHNIQLTFHEEKWCMVSKNKSPSIPFYHSSSETPVCSGKCGSFRFRTGEREGIKMQRLGCQNRCCYWEEWFVCFRL